MKISNSVIYEYTKICIKRNIFFSIIQTSKIHLGIPLYVSKGSINAILIYL